MRRAYAGALALATGGVVMACNALLGNADGNYVADAGGVEEASSDAGLPDHVGADGTTRDGATGDGATSDGATGDVVSGESGVVAFCQGIDSGYVFCTDFGADLSADPGALFDNGEVVLEGGALGFTDADYVSPPTSMFAQVATSSGQVSATVSELYSVPDGGVAIPSYVAFDTFVPDGACTGASAASSLLVFVRVGTGCCFYSAAQLATRADGYELDSVAFHPPDPIAYGPNAQLAASALPQGAWTRVRLDFQPMDAGVFQVTVSTGTAGQNAGGFTSVGSTTLQLDEQPTEAGVFDPTNGEVRLGLLANAVSTTECTFDYDNLVIGPLLSQ